MAATIPSSADIARAEKLVRERFLHDGEDPAVALAPGTPRRRALDLALAELEQDPKAKHPSTAWRREFSLLLGLERLLSDEEPKLVDGTVLSAHQVDALSGTLTALLAEAQRSGPGGNGSGSASPELLASADILGPDEMTAPDAVAVSEEEPEAPLEEDEEEPEEDDEDDFDEDDDELEPIQRAAPEEDEEDEEPDEDELEDEEPDEDDLEEQIEPDGDSEEEPRDWVDEDGEEEDLGEQPEDPN
ncbi:MAG TPA: hypothetical protein VGK85_01890, partial [Myxococcaceae bacterium]